MTVQELFEELNVYDELESKLFWKAISKSIEIETSYKGISSQEMKAYIDLNELRYSCACGNQPFNCICYSDAE